MENSSTEPIIRKATQTDLGNLLHMARTAFLQAFTAGNKPENVAAYLAEAFTLEQFGKELANPASTFFVAEQDSAEPEFFNISDHRLICAVVGTISYPDFKSGK